MLTKLTLTFFSIYVGILGVSGRQKTSCLRTYNVTIILNRVGFVKASGMSGVELDEDSNHFDLTAICPLASMLLRDPCIEVWMYSMLKRRSVQLNEESLIMDLTTENVAMKEIEINDFLEFISKLPPSTKTVEQSVILKIYRDTFSYMYSYEDNNDSRKKLDALRNLQNQKHYNIIVQNGDVSGENRFFLYFLKFWLPKHRLLKQRSRKENKHLNKIIVDLVKSVDFKEIEYFGHLKRECFSNNNTALNIIIKDIDPNFHEYDLDLIQWFFHSALDLKGLNIIWGKRLDQYDTFVLLASISEAGSQIKTQESIKVSVTHSMPNSPMLKEKGHIMVWEEDLYNPLFFRTLVDQMNVALCREN